MNIVIKGWGDKGADEMNEVTIIVENTHGEMIKVVDGCGCCESPRVEKLPLLVQALRNGNNTVKVMRKTS